MIKLTRLNGTEIYLNPILIESIESTPDTIVTMSNGHKYVVKESSVESTQLISAYLRSIGLLSSVYAESAANRGDVS